MGCRHGLKRPEQKTFPLRNSLADKHPDMVRPPLAPAMVSSPQDGFQSEDSPPQSSTASISGRSIHSARSTFLEDIKHEIMVNHLYQQQCSRLWVSDGSGECEGVLLRKARGHYLACPQPLLDSKFAQACAQLNVQVSPGFTSVIHCLQTAGCHDGELKSHQDIPCLGTGSN